MAAVVFALAPCASPHPMGNFSVSHYAAIQVARSEVKIRYIVDMAEIPTFQQMQDTGVPANAADARVTKYVAHEQEILRSGLRLFIDHRELRLHSISRQVLFTPGAGGLPTMKLGFVFTAAFDLPDNVKTVVLDYLDDNFPDRIGWKEIIASASNGTTIVRSSVPGKDRSLALTNYPADLISSPPQQLTAHVEYSIVRERQVSIAALPATAPILPPPTSAPKVSQPRLAPNANGTPRSAFTELINRSDWGL